MPTSSPPISPLALLDRFPRRILVLTALACAALLAYGLYLQHAVGLDPCPMCIVQRYALLLVGVLAAIAAALRGRLSYTVGLVSMGAMAGAGAFVAARQSFLQWYPPEVLTCGRDLYGMIESFPLKRVIPMVFKGSGDCSKIDWTFLGLTIANWSFVCFALIVVLALLLFWRRPAA